MKATYAEIKDYELKEHGLKASSLYISQEKKKCGMDETYEILCIIKELFLVFLRISD